jgi:hypothetical protein
LFGDEGRGFSLRSTAWEREDAAFALLRSQERRGT